MTKITTLLHKDLLLCFVRYTWFDKIQKGVFVGHQFTLLFFNNWNVLIYREHYKLFTPVRGPVAEWQSLREIGADDHGIGLRAAGNRDCSLLLGA